MYIPRRSIHKAWLAMLGWALLSATATAAAQDDPPDRVARLSYLRGDVSFQAAGDDDWVQAVLNRPLVTGDQLYTDQGSRVEMDIGASTIRMDERTSFELLNLDDNIAQIQLSQGVLNLHVRRVFEGQSYEIDTPTLAFVVTQPGDYRVDIAPDSSSTMVTVFRGSADVYGENNASYAVEAGNSYRFHDSALRDYEVLDLPRGDDFDNWVDSRNNRYERSVSRRYVSEEVIGYADLDDYGGWSDVPEYGSVWYPSTVEVGWAPYRSGHWAWVDPWGWTWVDNAPWGFAPFHYGRWVYVGSRWGWCPGPRHVRPIYAPALVGFVGGSGWSVGISVGGGGPVGWFPLGPRDVYVPWYHTSRNYFTNVNVRNTTIVNNTYITNVYNNYSAGRPITNANYAYRQNVNAVTAVPRDVFVGARPIAAARVQVNERQLRDASVVSRVGIAPERSSFAAANAARARPPAQALDRRVIARTAPPPRPAPVNARIDAIKRNNDQPLPSPQLRQIAGQQRAAPGAQGGRPQPAAATRERVQVVGQNAQKPQPLPARGAAGNAQRTSPADRAAPQRGNANAPAPSTRGQPERGQAGQSPDRQAPQRGNAPARGSQQQPGSALPSSRFAPHAGQQPGGNDARQAPSRSSGNAPSSSRTAPALPRSNDRTTAPRPDSPANRSAPRDDTPSRSAPARGSSPSENFAPRGNSGRTQPSSSAPTQRSAPVERNTPRSAPVERSTPRSSPPPVQRSEPASPRYDQQPRSAPREVQRSAPREVERSAPPQQMQRAPQPQQQRSAPPPQQMQRAPQPQQQRAPQQQERRAPPQRERRDGSKDKDDNGGHR